MNLEKADFFQFAKLHWGLLLFVNRTAEIFPDLNEEDAFQEVLAQKIEAKLELFQAFYENPSGYIDGWLASEPELFSKEDREIVESWKSLKHGKFIVFRQLKKHAVFLDGGSEDVYAVLGLTEPVANALGWEPPAMVETALFPFKGVIVYDGVMSRYSVHLGGNIRKGLNDRYNAAKNGPGLITSLSPLGIPKKKRTAAGRVQGLAGKLRGILKAVRQSKLRVRDFEENVDPPFREWIRKNLGDLQSRLEELEDESDRLAELLDRAEMSWRFREYGTRAETLSAVESAMREDEEAFKKSQESDAETEGDNDADDRSHTGESGSSFPFPDSPFFDDMPDFILDSLLAEFLREMRGVDFYRLSAKEKKKARADFQASFSDVASGDRKSFEKTMLKIGADESEANQAAVKKVFRRLARQVHPDRNENYDEEASEIWEELQMLKESLDLASLKNLELKWRLIQEDRFNGRDEKGLKRLLESMRKEEIDLEIKIEELSGHPMWGRKPSKTPPKGVQKRVKLDLKDAISHFEAVKAELEREINEFRSKPATKKAKAISRKKTSKRAVSKK